jgi:hypothetical protein
MEPFTHIGSIHLSGRSRRLPLSVPRLTRVRAAKENLTIFPPFDSHEKDTGQLHDKHDSPLDFGFDDDNTMAHGEPFIKPEPTDFGFDPNQFMQYNHQGQPNGNMNVNPANLTNGSNFNHSSFNMGNSGIADDELLDLAIENNQQNNGFDFNQGMQNFLSQQQMNQNGQSAAFSHTPDGAPIQSPFENGSFSFGQFRPTGQPQFGGHSMPQQAGSFRPHMQSMDRKVSDTRSPATPNTPAMNLQIGDDYTHPGMQRIQHQRQQSSLGGNGWDSTPSGHSWNESSPFPSPNGHQIHHAQISEVLKSNPQHHHHKVASSLPTKMEGGGTTYQSQEAKRRRRRESHNLVERRRRDNINERIHDLGGLVPQHRLEDEKVRKHLQTNAPLSPSIANAGLSPPAATSLLAGPSGRRATGAGNITQGLPIEDKDKGPNKGDILNGSVAWTRDLMWYIQLKLQQEEQLKELVSRLGGAWPFEQSVDEKRMSSEIWEVLNKHNTMGNSFAYTRAPGTGLRVPGFTNVAGDSINSDGQVTSNGYPTSSVSPGFQSGGSGMSSGQTSHQQNQYWNGDFKEEDEYGMEMQ